MATGKATKRPTAPAGYLALIRRFPLRPLRSEADLDQAIALTDELLDRAALDPAEADYLDVLSDLIHRYEAKQHPIGGVSDGEMLAFLIDQKGVRQAAVARATGVAESTLSEVRSGKRRLTRGQIEKLARYFRVSPGVFLSTAMKDAG